MTAAALKSELIALGSGSRDYDSLLEDVGGCEVVLLGEASHGTHEFYAERARITQMLIEHHGFEAVAVEADWPDAYRVNCYVRGAGEDADGDAALGDFGRFPVWMWRNTAVSPFVEWLREHDRASDAPVGFYGLDLYSLHSSIEAVLRYLDRVDPAAAGRARARYACFDRFASDSQAYGYETAVRGAEACEDDVVDQLLELQRSTAEYARADGRLPADAHFFALQNARLVAGAERYYRAMFRGRSASWNLRDRHMAETLAALQDHLRAQGGSGRVVVWAHNSHIGDARATEFARDRQLNLGQLARERYGDRCRLVGFTTYTGTVRAASDWDGPDEVKRVRSALDNSYEALMHTAGVPAFALALRPEPVAGVLAPARLERAIGVIYRPDTERASHYFEASLSDQFDWLIHIDTTTAVQPLAPRGGPEPAEPPETYPSAL